MTRSVVRIIFCSAIASAALLAMFPPGEKTVPIDRLILNTTAAIRQDPKNADAYYLLGRLHALAFANVAEAGAFIQRNQALPFLSPHVPERPVREEPGRLHKSDIDHANSSIQNYRHAIELNPKLPLYHYSLGWTEQESSRFADQLGKSSAEWMDLALADYRAAYRLSLPDDLKKKSYLLPFLSDEAGTAVLEILKHRGVRDSDPEVADIRKNITVLRGKSRTMTPVIFSTRPASSVEDLLSEREVPFDLDGFKTGRSWPWVKPDTCILVWDPDRTGFIRSGRQLFGSVTWWMFWRNGYEPLAALDDNRNGMLSGAELTGIAVWRDANLNGIADPGEVVPVEKFGVTQIAVRPESVNGTLQSHLRMRDGSRLKTFDWTPTSRKPIS